MANKTIIQKEFKVAGANGELFSVTDDFDGILHSVSDISGIPIFKVEDDGTSTFSGEVVMNDRLYYSGSSVTQDIIGGQLNLGAYQYALDFRSTDGEKRFGVTNLQAVTGEWTPHLSTKTNTENYTGFQITVDANQTSLNNKGVFDVLLRRTGATVVGDSEVAFRIISGTSTVLSRIYGDGTIEAPGATNAEIVSRGAQTLITKTFGDNYYWNVAGTTTITTPTLTGSATFTGNVTALDFILASDKTLKEKIVDLTKEPSDFGLNVVYKQFEYKHDKGRLRAGILANDIELEYPELVHVNYKGELSVSYIDLLIREIAALKDEMSKVKIKIK